MIKSETRIKIKDEIALLAALDEMGFKHVEYHHPDRPVPLYGYQGDQRPEKANIIIRRRYLQRMSNDLGFTRESDGTYSAIISEYDRRFYNEAWLNKVSQLTALNAVEQKAKREGKKTTRQIVGGKLQLELRGGF